MTNGAIQSLKQVKLIRANAPFSSSVLVSYVSYIFRSLPSRGWLIKVRDLSSARTNQRAKAVRIALTLSWATDDGSDQYLNSFYLSGVISSHRFCPLNAKKLYLESAYNMYLLYKLKTLWNGCFWALNEWQYFVSANFRHLCKWETYTNFDSI